MKIIRKEAVKETRGVRPMGVTTQREEHKKARINREKDTFPLLIRATWVILNTFTQYLNDVIMYH